MTGDNIYIPKPNPIVVNCVIALCFCLLYGGSLLFELLVLEGNGLLFLDRIFLPAIDVNGILGYQKSDIVVNFLKMMGVCCKKVV